jgi:hypothetical protein
MDKLLLTKDIEYQTGQSPNGALRDLAIGIRAQCATLSAAQVTIKFTAGAAVDLANLILAHTAPPSVPAEGVRVRTDPVFDVEYRDDITPRGGWLAFVVVIPVAMLATYGACALILRVLP